MTNLCVQSTICEAISFWDGQKSTSFISDRALVLVPFIFIANSVLMSCLFIHLYFKMFFLILIEQFINLPIHINFFLIFK